MASGPAHVAGLSWGGTVVLELYRHHPGLVATLILADTYAGWKGSLPAEEVRARVAEVRRMLESPADEFDPKLLGLFAGDPPAEFVPLLEEVAAEVRPESLGNSLSAMAEARASPSKESISRRRPAPPLELARLQPGRYHVLSFHRYLLGLISPSSRR